MKNRVELPLTAPVYGTYHAQGISGAVIADNPSIRNWFLNFVMQLSCTRRFLCGYGSPEVNIYRSGFLENPYLHVERFPMRYQGEQTNSIIRSMLNDGYYVSFTCVDDYYVEGKSWYGRRHFNHDGLICGYDDTKQTFRMFAYDQNWIYRCFDTPQQGFDAGRQYYFDQGIYGALYAIFPKPETVSFVPGLVFDELEHHLDSTVGKYPLTDPGTVYGTAVHDFIVMYLDKLADHSIPYERTDPRVFRMLWEHKTLMLERVRKTEEVMKWGHGISERYADVVTEASNMRMLYASHHMRQRDSLLPVIRRKLVWVRETEQQLLEEFMKKARGSRGT